LTDHIPTNASRACAGFAGGSALGGGFGSSGGFGGGSALRRTGGGAGSLISDGAGFSGSFGCLGCFGAGAAGLAASSRSRRTWFSARRSRFLHSSAATLSATA